VPLAEEAGFHLAGIVERTTDVYLESPLEATAGIEGRSFSKLGSRRGQVASHS
jgi:hypothetical protein